MKSVVHTAARRGVAVGVLWMAMGIGGGAEVAASDEGGTGQGTAAGSATGSATAAESATATGSAAESATAAGSATATESGYEPATDIVSASLYPRRGEWRVSLTLDLDLSGHRGGSRALSPDASWGITDETSLTLAHSARSIARIGHPGGACISSCDFRPSYTVNALVHHALLQPERSTQRSAPSSFQLYLAGGFLLRDTDPWKPAALGGASLRWHRGRFAVDAEPYLQLGIANTDRGNRHRLVVPLRLWLQPTCRWALGLFSGVEGELAVFSDAYHVPLALLASTRITSSLSLSLSAGLSTFGGPLNTATRRFAALTLETAL